MSPFIDPSTGTAVNSPEFCCKVLKDQYDSVFSAPRPAWKIEDLNEHFQTEDSPNTLSDFWFNEKDIEKACMQLSSSSAPGPDGVPAALLKNCKEQLSLPLYHLWRSSLDCGIIPEELLLVTICPIHKGGPRSSPKQYRPVALTSHLIKVFERVLREKVVSHIERNNLLPDGQHGSRGL